MVSAMQHLDRFNEHDRDLLERALRFATSAHAPQRRVSGEPYITHPVAVAELLILEFNADAQTIAAGLLHDTVEDTPITLEDVEKEFGPAVRRLVDGATDAGKGDGREAIPERSERDAASHAKVEEYAAIDPRLYLVKIADRWHNMLHCSVLRTKNQKRLALETLQFHVLWAHKLGFAKQAEQITEVCESVLAKVGRLESDAAAQRNYLS